MEPELSRELIPIPNLPENFIWMKVRGGSKMHNLLSYALKEFENERAIVWSGSGGAIGKVISCVEIMKRHHRNAFQISKICYHKAEEFWEPYFEEMDSIVVEREVPTIHVLLSKDTLNKEEPGYANSDPRLSNFEVPRHHKEGQYKCGTIPTYFLVKARQPNCSQLGYQAPGTCGAWKSKGKGPKESASGSAARRNKCSKISPERFAAMGLRSNQKRACLDKTF